MGENGLEKCGGRVDRNAVAAHRDMIIAIRDKVVPMVQGGMTVEQVSCTPSSRPAADRTIVRMRPSVSLLRQYSRRRDCSCSRELS